MKEFLIAPSILAADFARLGEDIAKVLASGADIIHFDVMDNHYVPNLTVGSIVCQSLRNYGILAPIDVHLMVKPVDHLAIAFAKAGATSISFHPEATKDITYTLALIKNESCKVGLVFNPNTDLSCLNNIKIIDKLDIILLMSVNPGFSGQSFIPTTLDTLCQVRKLIDKSGYNIRLGVDGGINVANIYKVAKAGADMFVAGTAIFKQPNYKTVIEMMRCELVKVFSPLVNDANH